MGHRFLSKYDGSKRKWLKAAEHFVILVLVLILVFRVLIGVSRVSGSSMEPSFHDRETVVYLRTVRDYKVGDVVSVKMPSGEYYIKRVVAVAGDTVDIRDGVLYVNGAAEETEKTMGATLPQEGVSYPLTVNRGRVFVLGDNREDSMDSRSFGAVAISQTRGRILFGIG